jgi:hypothetical protein
MTASAAAQLAFWRTGWPATRNPAHLYRPRHLWCLALGQFKDAAVAGQGFWSLFGQPGHG